jgi:hypothetical protein
LDIEIIQVSIQAVTYCWISIKIHEASILTKCSNVVCYASRVTLSCGKLHDTRNIGRLTPNNQSINQSINGMN